MSRLALLTIIIISNPLFAADENSTAVVSLQASVEAALGNAVPLPGRQCDETSNEVKADQAFFQGLQGTDEYKNGPDETSVRQWC